MVGCFTSGGGFLDSGAFEISCLGAVSFFGESCCDGGGGLLTADAGTGAAFGLGWGDDGTGASSPPSALCI